MWIKKEEGIWGLGRETTLKDGKTMSTCPWGGGRVSISGDLEGSGVGLGRGGSREWRRGEIDPSPAGGPPILGRRAGELQV